MRPLTCRLGSGSALCIQNSVILLSEAVMAQVGVHQLVEPRCSRSCVICMTAGQRFGPVGQDTEVELLMICSRSLQLAKLFKDSCLLTVRQGGCRQAVIWCKQNTKDDMPAATRMHSFSLSLCKYGTPSRHDLCNHTYLSSADTSLQPSAQTLLLLLEHCTGHGTTTLIMLNGFSEWSAMC